MKYILLVIWSLALTATSVSAQSNYRIKSGDTVSIEVLEDSSLNRSLLVLPDGTVNFPFAGTIAAAGRTPSELQTAIISGIADNFANRPTVFVSVSGLAPPSAPVGTGSGDLDIYFVGEVNTPGLRPVKRGTTFLQAIAQSGGLTRFAALKRVQLRRFDPRTGQQHIFKMDLKALADGAELTNNVTLRDGDVILVPERRLFE